MTVTYAIRGRTSAAHAATVQLFLLCIHTDWSSVYVGPPPLTHSWARSLTVAAICFIGGDRVDNGILMATALFLLLTLRAYVDGTSANININRERLGDCRMLIYPFSIYINLFWCWFSSSWCLHQQRSFVRSFVRRYSNVAYNNNGHAHTRSPTPSVRASWSSTYSRNCIWWRYRIKARRQ